MHTLAIQPLGPHVGMCMCETNYFTTLIFLLFLLFLFCLYEFDEKKKADKTKKKLSHNKAALGMRFYSTDAIGTAMENYMFDQSKFENAIFMFCFCFLFLVQ